MSFILPLEKIFVPLLPQLLNEVHRIIVECDMRFVLCGSSARKLRRRLMDDVEIYPAVDFLKQLWSDHIID